MLRGAARAVPEPAHCKVEFMELDDLRCATYAVPASALAGAGTRLLRGGVLGAQGLRCAARAAPALALAAAGARPLSGGVGSAGRRWSLWSSRASLRWRRAGSCGGWRRTHESIVGFVGYRAAKIAIEPLGKIYGAEAALAATRQRVPLNHQTVMTCTR